MRIHHPLLVADFFSSLLYPSTLIWADHDLEKPEEEGAFLELSQEELISLGVPDATSVSGRKQRPVDSAAAVYVITDEDIQGSGVTSIPEALRMAPGVQVVRLNGNTWSISTRGFNYIFANKLLTLIDGCTLHSSLLSGVNWDVQDTMLEDIARIEVIRGPGVALWGANAVNGVINIITKHAADTQGGLLSAGVSTKEKPFGAYRHGELFGDDGFCSGDFKSFKRDGLANSPASNEKNVSAADDWHINRGGFRTNWLTRGEASIVIQREFSVTHKAPAAPLNKLCDLVFIHSTDVKTTLDVTHRLKNKPVLTISDNENYANQGGMIGLYRAGGRTCFAISQNATHGPNLNMNSQLMAMAKRTK